MRRRLTAVLFGVAMIGLAGGTLAQADECKARVLSEGTLIRGNKIYSYWRLGHSPWRWATVAFRYRLTYVDETDKKQVLEGEFRQLVSGDEQTYTELKNTRHHPRRVILAKFSDLSCGQ